MLQKDPAVSPNANALRLRKPTVKDPRLIVGVLLVGVSMWLGIWTVDSAKDLSIAYVAAVDIAQGQPVSKDQLRAVEVNLGDTAGHYLTSLLNEDEHYFADVSIPNGQLVALSSISTQQESNSRVIAISTSSPMPQEIQVGGKVDLWAVPASNSQSNDTAPQEVAASLVVSQLPEKSGNLGNSRSNVAYVIVPLDRVAAVLAVTAGDYELTLLAAPR